MFLALDIFAGSALQSVEKWSQMQRSRISLSYLWFKFFMEGVNATTKQRERISKAVVQSCITTFAILRYIPFILMFPCVSDGKKKQFGSSSMPLTLLKALPLAMNLLKNVSAILTFLTLWLLSSGQADALAVSVGLGHRGDTPTPGGSPDKGMRGAAV